MFSTLASTDWRTRRREAGYEQGGRSATSNHLPDRLGGVRHPGGTMIPHVEVKPCGCIVTVETGHTHTKMCEPHRREAFLPRGQVAEPNNLDLVGG